MMKKTSIIQIIVIAAFSATAPAVTSVISRHESSADFLKGKTELVTVTSEGALELSLKSGDVDCGQLLEDAWSVHCMSVAADGALFLGTGPDAKVIRLEGDEVTQVYPATSSDLNNDDPNTADILNEHVFALAQDVAGRLLIAVSGKEGKLIRLGTESEVVFQDEKVQYIFDMVLDAENNIYLATGPEGRIYKLDPFCANPKVIYDADDKNILSLAVDGPVLYAGSDGRGLIYKIDLNTLRPAVLYDSEQNEVPDLWVDESGDVFAVTASAQAAQLQLKMPDASLGKSPGHPDSGGNGKAPTPVEQSLNTANNDKTKKTEEKKQPPQAPPAPAAKVAGHVYQVSSEGFVKDLFSEVAVFYSLMKVDGKLWAGTGNKGRLYTVDPESEEKAVVYEDKTSSQITAAIQYNDAIYLGLSNPARLVRLERTYVDEGVFKSALLDASQPARWGKLQLETDIPSDCRILMSCRSGNLGEPNDSTFSDWTPDIVFNEPVQLDCPIGRFCQYRLTLQTDDVAVTPVVREVAAAYVIPNLGPKVIAVKTRRSRDKKKPNIIEIGYSAKDDNKDQLEFTLEFRKAGRSVWIPLKEEWDKPRFEWDGRTVEDGRYEVRVTANDRKSNTPETMLTGARVSDVFVIDNSAPNIADAKIEVQDNDVLIKLAVKDALSVPGKVRYTIDSNEKWITAQPDDSVYDTLEETFTIQIEDLDSGDHVIAFSVADDLQNIMYKTYEVTIP